MIEIVDLDTFKPTKIASENMAVGNEKNETTDSKEPFYNLEESQEKPNENLVMQYLYKKYSDIALPRQYANKLNEALHFYCLFTDIINSLGKKLNLDFERQNNLYNSLYNDFHYDGGTNTASILKGHWTHKMVEQDIKKYKSSGKIPI
ncbi:MAG: hypothetical protein ACYC54_07760 [Sedimentisphaerales bacterium]